MSYDEHLISMAGGDGDSALRDNLLVDVTARNERLLAVIREQQAKIDRVRELHFMVDGEVFDNAETNSSHIHEICGVCYDCNEVPEAWPCPTIAAITATETGK